MRENLLSLNTPSYIYDEKALINNMIGFKEAVQRAWGTNNVIMGLSVKTAPIKGIVALGKNSGYYAEVVSDEEYDLALRAGYDPNRIIYNGPAKSRSSFRFAIKNGSLINIDSKRELRWLAELAHEGIDLSVGIRINFDLEKECPGETTAGSEQGRFGFCVEDGSLESAIDELRNIGACIRGIHAHFSTETHSVNVYRAICRSVLAVTDKYDLQDISYIDVGGGYYGGGEDTNAYVEYAECLASELTPLRGRGGVTLILEPGGSVLATAGSLLGEIIDSKTVRGESFVVTDLSSLQLNSTVYGRRRMGGCVPIFIDNECRKMVKRQLLCGFTCMEMDRFLLLENERALKEGDRVLIRNTGAYGASFAPRFFIKSYPSVYLRRSDGEFVPMEY